MMGARHFGNWIEAYLEWSDPISEAPSNIRHWAAISAISSALRGKVWIDQEIFLWKPNQFIIIVARPAIATKSTALGLAHSFAERIEGVQFGANSGSWQSTLDEMHDACQWFVDPETGQQFPSSSLTLGLDEAGTWIDPQDDTMAPVLCSLWDAKPGPMRRGTRQDGVWTIESPCLHLGAATTPTWVLENFDYHAIGGGLLSRCVMVVAGNDYKAIAYPSQVQGKKDAEHQQYLREDLEDIAGMVGEFRLTPEAIELGTQWYDELKELQVDLMEELDPLSGFRGRKQAHAHKLAIALSAAKRDTRWITAQDLEEAIREIDKVEDGLWDLARNLADSASARTVALLRRYMEIQGSVYKSQLYQDWLHRLSDPEIQEGLRALERAGDVRYGEASKEKGKLVIYQGGKE